MALDFPSSPTDGQIYGDWVFSSADSAWRKNSPIPGGLPAGSIIQWGGATAPSNWLLCDGSNVSRSTYASLFAAIGTSFGVGDGTTTFTLPDLRGRVPVGKNGGTFGTLGTTGGAETHTLTKAQLPAVTGDVRLHGGENGSNIWQPAGVFSTSDIRSNEYRTSSGINNGASSVGPLLRFNNGGQDLPHNNLQPYQVVNYIIKTTAATTADESTLTGRVGVLETAVATKITNKNHIHNGAFDVWQKGTSSGSSGGGIYVDRWHEYTDTGSGTQSRDATITVSGVTQQTYKFLAGGSGANMSLFQVLETQDSQELVGQTVTVSAWVRASSNSTLQFGMGYNPTADSLWTATGWISTNGSNFTAGTTMTRYSQTFTIPANAKTLRFGINTATNLGANVAVNIGGFKVEVGNTATPFVRASGTLEGEIVTCQRYYREGTAWGSTYYTSYPNGFNVGFQNSFPPMRVTPTYTGLTFQNNDNTANAGGWAPNNSLCINLARANNTGYGYFNCNVTFKLEAEI